MKQKVVFMFSGQGSHYFHKERIFITLALPLRGMDYLDHYVLRQRKYSILEYLYNPNHRLGSSLID